MPKVKQSFIDLRNERTRVRLYRDDVMSKRLAVVGLGKLGLPLASVLSKHYKVYGVDVSRQRVQQITTKENFFEPRLNEYLEEYSKNLEISTNYQLVKNCEIVFILTQTPSLPDGKFDSSFVESAVKSIHEVNSASLVVVSSTINIGDVNKFRKIHSRICYNPEFIKQGSIIHDFENPKMVLIGAYDPEEGRKVADVWRRIHSKPIHIVKPMEAEIIKLSLNVSFTLGITFANIIGELCEKFSADSDKVLDLIYQDRRNYSPGLGFGGPCFPRDVNCFKALCMGNSVDSGHRLASLLSNLNNYTVERYYGILTSYGKKKIGILGLAYKPDVPYTDESQSLKIAQKLIDEGFEVFAYDGLAEENAKNELRGNVFFCSSIDECVNKVEVIFIGTPNYKNIDTSKPVVNPWK